jgi:hypothetical protein
LRAAIRLLVNDTEGFIMTDEVVDKFTKIAYALRGFWTLEHLSLCTASLLMASRGLGESARCLLEMTR